jgi:hypothetical protein
MSEALAVTLRRYLASNTFVQEADFESNDNFAAAALSVYTSGLDQAKCWRLASLAFDLNLELYREGQTLIGLLFERLYDTVEFGGYLRLLSTIRFDLDERLAIRLTITAGKIHDPRVFVRLALGLCAGGVTSQAISSKVLYFLGETNGQRYKNDLLRCLSFSAAPNRKSFDGLVSNKNLIGAEPMFFTQALLACAQDVCVQDMSRLEIIGLAYKGNDVFFNMTIALLGLCVSSYRFQSIQLVSDYVQNRDKSVRDSFDSLFPFCPKEILNDPELITIVSSSIFSFKLFRVGKTGFRPAPFDQL